MTDEQQDTSNKDNRKSTPPPRSPLTALPSPLLGPEATRGQVAAQLPNLVQTTGRGLMKGKRVNNVASLRAVGAKERQITVRDSQLLARAIVKLAVNQPTSQGLPCLPLSQAVL